MLFLFPLCTRSSRARVFVGGSTSCSWSIRLCSSPTREDTRSDIRFVGVVLVAPCAEEEEGSAGSEGLSRLVDGLASEAKGIVWS